MFLIENLRILEHINSYVLFFFTLFLAVGVFYIFHSKSEGTYRDWYWLVFAGGVFVAIVINYSVAKHAYVKHLVMRSDQWGCDWRCKEDIEKRLKRLNVRVERDLLN